jgi:glycosyltransferase involved in cell wall biosynthesis
MLISVVIPTHKPKYLGKVLSSLKYQIHLNEDYEIIICENPENTEEVKELISNYNCLNIKLVNSDLGANNARNTGIAHSISDIIALLDDDCIPDYDWLYQISQSFNNKNISCIGGNVTLNIDKNLTALQSQYLTKINWGNTNPYRELQQGEYLASCNLAFKKSVYNKVGGFNANLGYLGKDNFIPNDEVLFIRDCTNHGKVCYNDNMRVLHLIDDRVNKSFFLKRAYGQGYANILLEREQGITGNCHHERIYYSDFNKTDIDLQIAKHIGMLHAVKGIQPSSQFYSLLEELVQA